MEKWRVVELLMTRHPSCHELKQFLSDLLHGFCAAAVAIAVWAIVLAIGAAIIANKIGVLGWRDLF